GSQVVQLSAKLKNMAAQTFGVAQISNRQALGVSHASRIFNARRLKALRYSRLEICATMLNTYATSAPRPGILSRVRACSATPSTRSQSLYSTAISRIGCNINGTQLS